MQVLTEWRLLAERVATDLFIYTNRIIKLWFLLMRGISFLGSIGGEPSTDGVRVERSLMKKMQCDGACWHVDNFNWQQINLTSLTSICSCQSSVITSALINIFINPLKLLTCSQTAPCRRNPPLHVWRRCSASTHLCHAKTSNTDTGVSQCTRGHLHLTKLCQMSLLLNIFCMFKIVKKIIF